MANEVKIDIQTTGNPKGAQEVGKSLDNLGKTSEATAAKVKKSAAETGASWEGAGKLSARQMEIWQAANEALEASQESLTEVADSSATAIEGALIPALEKVSQKADATGETLTGKTKPALEEIGGAAGGASGKLNQMRGKVEEVSGALGKLKSGAIVGAIVAIYTAFQKWSAELQVTKERAEEAFPPIIRGLEDVAAKQQAIVSPSDLYTASLARSVAEADKLRDSLAQQIADTEALAAAQTKLAIAQIDVSVKSGNLDAAEGERQKAELNFAAAEESYQRQTEAAKERLKLKEQELARAKEIEAVAASEAARTEAARNELASQRGDKGRAAIIDPSTNADVSAAATSRAALERQRAEEEARRASFSDVRESLEGSGNLKTVFTGGFIRQVAEAYNARKASEERIEMLNKEIAKVIEEENAARKARLEVINAEAENRVGAATEGGAALAAARAEVERLTAERAAAAEAVQRKTVGPEAQIFTTNQEAARVAASGPTATPQPPANPTGAADGGGVAVALAGLPSTSETAALQSAIQGGINTGEIGAVIELVKSLTLTLSGEGQRYRADIAALSAEVERVKAQLSDTSSR